MFIGTNDKSLGKWLIHDETGLLFKRNSAARNSTRSARLLWERSIILMDACNWLKHVEFKKIDLLEGNTYDYETGCLTSYIQWQPNGIWVEKWAHGRRKRYRDYLVKNKKKYIWSSDVTTSERTKNLRIRGCRDPFHLLNYLLIWNRLRTRVREKRSGADTCTYVKMLELTHSSTKKKKQWTVEANGPGLKIL